MEERDSKTAGAELNSTSRPENAGNFDLLRRFVRSRSVPIERCDLCSLGLRVDHPHLIEPATRKLICACQACAILFSNAADTKYRRVPNRIVRLTEFAISDAQWESLMIPINMAFFFQSSAAGRVVALYPSPAGATESLLDLETWTEIIDNNPQLKELQADVEALLVNRVQGASHYYIAPIDECFKLVGLIRTNWKGLSGGAEVWRVINEFFEDLKKRSSQLERVAHA